MGGFFAVLIFRADLREKLFAMMNKKPVQPVKKSRTKRIVKAGK